MKKRAVVVSAVLVLCGCDMTPPPPQPSPNNEVRERIFFECLRAVPKGPENVKYNDWAEVVEECGNQARYMSFGRAESK